MEHPEYLSCMWKDIMKEGEAEEQIQRRDGMDDEIFEQRMMAGLDAESKGTFQISFLELERLDLESITYH